MKNCFTCFLLFLLLSASGQTGAKWSLQDCIDYAIKHDVSIKEADVQRRLSALSVEQGKGSLWPSLNFSGSGGYRFGLSENPTTGILQSSNFFSTGFSLSSSVTLFNWFAKQHSLKATKAAAEADAMGSRKAEEDVTLAVSAAYFQALLSKEIISTAFIQVQQSSAQAEVTGKKVSAGVLSELDLAQIRQQQLGDSLALLAAQETYEKTLLQLKAVIALDAQTSIELSSLPVDNTASTSLLALTPEGLFAAAIKNLPQAKSLLLQAEAADERIKAAKAMRYPTLSLYGTAGSNFVNIPSAQAFTYIPQQPTGAKVQVAGVSYDVLAPSYSVSSYGITPFFRQMRKNFGQNIGLSISLPILNGRTFVLNQKRELLNQAQIKLQTDRFLQETKIAIYAAYSEATSACKKTGFSERLLTEAVIVFEGAKKRYALNLLSTQDLLIAQNNLQKVRTEAVLAHYDFAFKLKLLEFYHKPD